MRKSDLGFEESKFVFLRTKLTRKTNLCWLSIFWWISSTFSSSLGCYVFEPTLCFRANARGLYTIVEIFRISKIVKIFRISPKFFRKFWKTSRKIFCKKLFSPQIKFYTTPRVSTILQTHSGYLPDKSDDRNQFFFWPGTDFPSKSLMVITLTPGDPALRGGGMNEIIFLKGGNIK